MQELKCPDCGHLNPGIRELGYTLPWTCAKCPHIWRLQDVKPTCAEPVTPERDDFLAGICVALQCVTASDDGVLWSEIVQTAGVESLLRYATFVEPDEWELAGFKRYAQRELHRARPRKCVPKLKTPNARG